MFNCRICGLAQESNPWEDNCPNYDFCDCCGVEFGHQDSYREIALEYRENWLATGVNWKHEASKPADWASTNSATILETQLKDIKEEWR